MNYHARIWPLERFMKRVFSIISVALACLGLAGCSWISKDPCSGDDADLSNSACVVQSKQTYRNNDSRWFCIGNLEAKNWSCASSLEDAQIKHDAMPNVLAQSGQASSVARTKVLVMAPVAAEADVMAQVPDALPVLPALVDAALAAEKTKSAASTQLSVQGNALAAGSDTTGSISALAIVALTAAPSSTALAVTTAIAAAEILPAAAVSLAPEALSAVTPTVAPNQPIQERPSRPANAIQSETMTLAAATALAAGAPAVPVVVEAPKRGVELSPSVVVAAAVALPLVDMAAEAPVIAMAAVEAVAGVTTVDAAQAQADLVTLLEVDIAPLEPVVNSTIAVVIEATPIELKASAPGMAIAKVDAVAEPRVVERPKASVAAGAVPKPLEIAAVDTPIIEPDSETPKLVDAWVETVSEPRVAKIIEAPSTVDALFPVVVDAPARIEAAQSLEVLAEMPEQAPAKVVVANLAIASNLDVQPSAVVAAIEMPATTPELAIATEVVIAAAEPFPAGTTLAEVYTEHVQRFAQLPVNLQTLGPKGALPEPAVASTRSARPVDPRPTPVQQSSSRNRSVAQTPHATHAMPTVSAVASASKLDSIPVGSSGLDYASMAHPATSGDGTYDYFMDLPAADFAIQLKAEKNLAAIQAFAATVSLEDPLVLKTELMKRPLYVLVLDTFNDIQLASDAKRAWMVQYNNGIEPWIRTVGSLQKTLQPIGPMD